MKVDAYKLAEMRRKAQALDCSALRRRNAEKQQAISEQTATNEGLSTYWNWCDAKEKRERDYGEYLIRNKYERENPQKPSRSSNGVHVSHVLSERAKQEARANMARVLLTGY